MTTRFKPHDVMEGLTGAVHECGHALYEQGRNPGARVLQLCICDCDHFQARTILLCHREGACWGIVTLADSTTLQCIKTYEPGTAPLSTHCHVVASHATVRADYEGLPISEALSLGVHESQSLLWERMVALTPAFCRFLLPRIQATFPDFGQGKSAEVLHTCPLHLRDMCCWRGAPHCCTAGVSACSASTTDTSRTGSIRPTLAGPRSALPSANTAARCTNTMCRTSTRRST